MKFPDYQAAQGVTKLPRPDGAVDPHMLRLGRQSRGLSLTALAKTLGLTSHELQWIEQGKLACPPDKLGALCDALDYTAEFFTDAAPAALLRRLREGHTFMCSADSYTASLDETVDAEAEVRLLRQRVRELERQLGYRG